MQALEAGVVAKLQQENTKVAQLVELNDQLKQAFRDYAKRSVTLLIYSAVYAVNASSELCLMHVDAVQVVLSYVLCNEQRLRLYCH
jgi:hypothetical protein